MENLELTEKLGQTNFDDSPAWGAPEDEVLLTSSELEAEISELKQKIQKIVTTTTDMDPMKEPVKLWPNGRVPYVISEELDSSAREKINEAIEEFHQKTCVNFEPRLKSDQDYVHFVPHQEFCWTYVGNIGLDSPIYLTPFCQRSKPAIQHEMMHTLGNV